MADEKEVPKVPTEISKFALEPLNHALAAGCRQGLAQGINVHEVIEMLLNHMASVVAMVEPAGAREELLKGLVASFAGMVRQHVDARYTTPGGIKLPGAGLS